mmetsp:Transcript_6845/g.19367  ORF Transcript_6845/g.19367 Transcript_6845/m.19367 type:complete len:306 (-) Transcript_6845:529-1446(-)
MARPRLPAEEGLHRWHLRGARARGRGEPDPSELELHPGPHRGLPQGHLALLARGVEIEEVAAEPEPLQPRPRQDPRQRRRALAHEVVPEERELPQLLELGEGLREGPHAPVPDLVVVELEAPQLPERGEGPRQRRSAPVPDAVAGEAEARQLLHLRKGLRQGDRALGPEAAPAERDGLQVLELREGLGHDPPPLGPDAHVRVHEHLRGPADLPEGLAVLCEDRRLVLPVGEQPDAPPLRELLALRQLALEARGAHERPSVPPHAVGEVARAPVAGAAGRARQHVQLAFHEHAVRVQRRRLGVDNV